MEDMLIFLAVLLAIAVLAAPIGVMVLFRKVRGLQRRIEHLEQRGLTPKAQSVQDSPWVAPEVRRAETKKLAAGQEQATLSAATEKTGVDGSAKQSAQVPHAFVFRGALFRNALAWIKDNWFLGIAALSLALAGVFMVQYGVEQGLLTPFARIMGALGLGGAFILGGEFLRRRFGDNSETLHALPSTFSGAGIVTLFAAVLSARHLYDMLPSDLALIGLIAVALLAVALGWFYGPFLAAIGIIGALAAPFVVGGSSDAPHLFYYYFALIVVMALSIDTVRRWAWVSVLALVGGFGASWLLLMGGAQAVHALGFAFICVLAATAIPQRRIWPDQSGAMLSEMALKLRRKGKTGSDWPAFPTRLAGATFVAALALGAFIPLQESGTLVDWLGLYSIAALGVLALVWMARAPALEDLSALAPLLLLTLLFVLAADNAAVYQDFAYDLAADRGEGAGTPRAASIFTAIFAVFATLGFWRAANGVRASLIWLGASALALPAAFGVLELFWAPGRVIGAYQWAGHAMAAAALMTLLAERAARRWPADMRPAALYAMSALSLITFAIMLILSAAALSIAIAVMIVIAALIDRRFDMPWLGLFIQLAVAVLGWRFIVDPGLPWAFDNATSIFDIILGYAVPLGLMGLAWWILRAIVRQGAQLALESAVWALGALFVMIILNRALGGDTDSFWGLSLTASVGLTSMGAQLYRWRKGARFGLLRLLLAAFIGLLSFAALFIALVGLSPLTSWGARSIQGPLVFDTIAIGYLVPALVLGVLVWKLSHIHKFLRAAFAVIAALCAASYVALEIRRFWQGEQIASNAVGQGELYSYTIAMMLGSVALLLFAFSRRSDGLRKLAMAGIALTIAKVFLLDMSGLGGLVRVASFLGLGLALSGLAWLNRAMSARWDRSDVRETDDVSEKNSS